ncbi:MAG: YkgJ family cysteine cluster protein [Flavobacteriales bacterium]|nr:YkgJ family cysteine cluster protein [Flavobacteriales bacterium]
MEEILNSLKQKAHEKQKENKKFLAVLSRQNKQKKVDEVIHEIHDETFDNIDCMECGNCCKTTGPLFTDKDVSRIAGKLKMKDVDFISTYLRVDEDNDYVLQEVPCAFLGEDNFCSIYDFRPKACREFPHTDVPKQSQLFDLLLKNTYECPAAYKIVEEMKKHYENDKAFKKDTREKYR